MGQILDIPELNLIRDLLIPLVAAATGIWLATRKFRSEHIWKQKYEAYLGVLQSLDTIALWGSETQADVHAFANIGTENIFQEFKSAQREILRQAAIGSLLLSPKFLDVLKAFNDRFFSEKFDAAEDSHDDVRDQEIAWGDFAGRVCALVDDHLPKLISLARKDLGVMSFGSFEWLRANRVIVASRTATNTSRGP